MGSDRSYEGMHAGQQRYAVIEFCSNPEVAWAKIASGKYDWLGMKRRTFVFGRPPAGGFGGGGAMTIGEAGADGSHAVEIRTPRGPGPSRQLLASAEAARQVYDDTIARLEKRDGSSGLWRVRLIVDGSVEAEQLAVRLLPNVL